MAEVLARDSFGRLERRGEVLALVLDEAGKKVNTLGSRQLSWLDLVLARVEAERPRGLILLSGKADTFVAGADLEELAAFKDPNDVQMLLTRGHGLLARLAALPCPTVAAIAGPCLGGGLELALACTARVATTAPSTRLGLPEVRLGLIPGLGGTQRLPRLVGVPVALDLLTTGRALDAEGALAIGLIDATSAPARLWRTAVELLECRPRAPARGSLGQRAIDLAAHWPGLSQLVFGRALRQVRAKTGGRYPAAEAAVAVVAAGLREPLPRALGHEATAFSQLVVSATARNLIAIFFRKNEVEKKAAEIAGSARPIRAVGVLGAGFMGSGIAHAAAAAGLPVILTDHEPAVLRRALSGSAALFAAEARRKKWCPGAAKTALARLRPTLDRGALRGAEVVIEAVFEDLALKQALLRELEAVTPERQVFASNTSAIPIAKIAAASRRPWQVVGMHFFSPVAKMPLVEVIRHPSTSRETLATAVELGRRLKKTVIVVSDGPGFFTTRVLAPFLNEAVWCLADGASIEQVDRALLAWGWPAGALALMDEVGLDVGRHASRVLEGAFGVRFAPPALVESLVTAGHLGRKSGRGFYDYGGRSKRPSRELVSGRRGGGAPLAEREIAERCFLAMLNEAARAVEDGILTSPAEIDLAVLLGFGFPAFRGGLLCEAERIGLSKVVEELEEYAARLGPRFTPARLLLEMAQAGERFYG